MREINQKIVGFSVKSSDPTPVSSTPVSSTSASSTPASSVVEAQETIMNELIARPDVLVGSTYKISKSPASEHALYVTINDIVLDEGTKFETRRPFEIFINSKSMDQFQWIVAVTRILSAVFRKGGDVTFTVEEMKAVFDPHGGYFRKGGYVPSLIAEIGGIVETHLKKLGMIEGGMDEATQQLIQEKRDAYEASQAQAPSAPKQASQEQASQKPASPENGTYPPNATMCQKCFQKATVILDGCATCLNCGASKCG